MFTWLFIQVYVCNSWHLTRDWSQSGVAKVPELTTRSTIVNVEPVCVESSVLGGTCWCSKTTLGLCSVSWWPLTFDLWHDLKSGWSSLNSNIQHGFFSLSPWPCVRTYVWISWLLMSFVDHSPDCDPTNSWLSHSVPMKMTLVWQVLIWFDYFLLYSFTLCSCVKRRLKWLTKLIHFSVALS